MRTRVAVLAFTVAGALAMASPGRAADSGFALEAEGGYQDLTQAKNSAKAVFDGSSGGATYGGGLRYTFHNGFFVSGWARTFSKDGQRAFVADATSPVFPLGHPLSVKIVPVQATIGFRAAGRNSLVTPYVGIGGGFTSYHEESTVGGVTDTVSEKKASGHVLAGAEVGHGTVRLGVEGGYAFVPNSIGIGGVSKIYGETGIGGFWVVGKLIFAFGGR